MEALTDSERETLSQLQAITNGADLDIQISLLQSVNWDLEVCLSRGCLPCHSDADHISRRQLKQSTERIVLLHPLIVLMTTTKSHAH